MLGRGRAIAVVGTSAPSGSSCPARAARPAASAARRAAVLLPISAIASGGGPMKVRPARAHASANAAFSARKP